MAKDAMTKVIEALRSGAWLGGGRLSGYPWVFLAVGAMVGLGWVLSAKGLVDPRGMPLGSDFLGFFAASRVELGLGGAMAYDPQHLAAAETAAMGQPVPFFAWLYPPTALLLVLPLGLLPYGSAFFLWCAGQLALAVAVLRRIQPHRLTIRIALAFPATFLCLAHGQNALLSTALLGGGLLFLPRRPALAGMLFAALLYKPHLGVLIPLALLAGRQWRALGASLAAGLIYLSVTLAVPGTQAWQAFLAHGAFARAVLEQGWVDWGKMAAPYAGLRLLGLGSAAAWGGQGIVSLLAAIAVVRLWRGDGTPAVKAAGLAAAGLLATPFLLDYDLMILALPIAWLVSDAEHTGWRPWEATILAAAWLSPVLVRPFGLLLDLPLGPVVAGSLLALALRRSRAAGPVIPRLLPDPRAMG